MRNGRLLVVLGLLVAVAAILLGYRLRVLAAGGRVLFQLAGLGVLLWLVLWRAGPPSPDLDKDGKHVR